MKVMLMITRRTTIHDIDSFVRNITNGPTGLHIEIDVESCPILEVRQYVDNICELYQQPKFQWYNTPR